MRLKNSVLILNKNNDIYMHVVAMRYNADQSRIISPLSVPIRGRNKRGKIKTLLLL